MISAVLVTLVGALALRSPNPDSKLPYWAAGGLVAFLAAVLAVMETKLLGF